MDSHAQEQSQSDNISPMRPGTDADDVDTFVRHLQSIPELKIHTTFVIPLLKKMGATHVRYVHGSFERGKDIVYVQEDQYGDVCLEVCQVKNEPLSGKAHSSANTIGVLNQLRQARDTQVMNPATNRLDLPQQVVLLTTYPIPDRDVAGAQSLLDELHRSRCKVVGPEKFARLIRTHLPHLFDAIAAPQATVTRGLRNYLDIHHEARVFSLMRQRPLSETFVNLGITHAGTILQRIETLPNASIDFKNKRRALKAADFASLTKFQQAISEELAPIRVLEIDDDTRDSDIILVKRVDFSEFMRVLQREFARLLAGREGGTTDTIKPIARALDLVAQANEFGALIVEALRIHLDEGKRGGGDRSFSIEEVPPEALLELNSNICLLGEAGAGKTSLARAIARVALARGLKCAYFPCSQVRQPRESLKKAMIGFLASFGDQGASHQAKALLAGAEAVILDGCDEASSFTTRLASDLEEVGFVAAIREGLDGKPSSPLLVPTDLASIVEYDSVQSAIMLHRPIRRVDFVRLRVLNQCVHIQKALARIEARLAEENPRVIVTTREAEQFGLDSSYIRVTLLPFTDQQLKRFLDRWFHGTNRPVENLWQFLTAHDYLRAICRTPIVATIVAALYENGRDLPQSKTEVYESRLNLLLSDWDQARGVEPRNKIRLSDKKVFLMRVAYLVHKDHQRSFGREIVESVWVDAFSRLYPQLTVDDLLTELAVADAVIYKIGREQYSLGHLSYQEFLTASYIVRAQRSRELLAKFQDSWWRQVIVFYAGLSADISLFLARIQKLYPLPGGMGLVEQMMHEARFTSAVTRDAILDMAADDSFEEEEDEYLDESELDEDDDESGTDSEGFPPPE